MYQILHKNMPTFTAMNQPEVVQYIAIFTTEMLGGIFLHHHWKMTFLFHHHQPIWVFIRDWMSVWTVWVFLTTSYITFLRLHPEMARK
jgi:hypothetical protein